MVYEKGIFLSEEHFQLVKPEINGPIRCKRMERICSLETTARTKIIICQNHLQKTKRQCTFWPERPFYCALLGFFPPILIFISRNINLHLIFLGFSGEV